MSLYFALAASWPIPPLLSLTLSSLGGITGKSVGKEKKTLMRKAAFEAQSFPPLLFLKASDMMSLYVM